MQRQQRRRAATTYIIWSLAMLFAGCQPPTVTTDSRTPAAPALASASPGSTPSPTLSSLPTATPAPTAPVSPGAIPPPTPVTVFAPTFKITAPTSPSTVATPLVGWQAASGATSYTLNVGADSGCTAPTQTYRGVATTSQALTALAGGTWYLCLSATNGTASYAAANTGYPLVITLAPAAPPAVITITGPSTSTLSSTPTITWGSTGSIATYNLQVGASASCSPALQSYRGVNATSQPLRNLGKGTWYACLQGNVGTLVLPAANTGFAFTISNHPPTLQFASQTGASNWSGSGTPLAPYTLTIAGGTSPAVVQMSTADLDGDTVSTSCSGAPSWATLSGASALLTFAPLATDVTAGVSFSCKANDGTDDSNLIYFQAVVTPMFNVTGPVNAAATYTPTVTWDSVPAATSFKVTITSDAGCTTVVQTISAASGTSQILTEMPRGNYFACVSALVGSTYYPAGNNGFAFTTKDHPPTWNTTLGAQWVTNNSALALTLSATDLDPADTVSYSLDRVAADTTCLAGVTWQAPGLRVTGNQLLGTPTSALDVVTCMITVYANSGGVALPQTVNLTVYPELPTGFTCDSGSVATTCNVSTTHTVSTVGAVIAGVGNLVIQSGGVIAAPAAQSIAIKFSGDVEIQSGGSVAANLSTLNATDFILDAGGSINVNSLGYIGVISGFGGGPGGGGSDIGGSGAGGSHGGVGSRGNGSSTQPPYGSATQPVTYGSGGGGDPTNHAAKGGNGGGAVKLNITAAATINGQIDASGGDVSSTCCAGGGAGGSVWIVATSLVGTVSILVPGGDGGLTQTNSREFGGGGGGGRIAIYVTSDQFSGTVSVARGHTDGHTSGSADGTFYTSVVNPCDSGTLATSCTISSARSFGADTVIAGAGNLIVASGGNLTTPSPATSIALAMGGDITVQSGGQITASLKLSGSIPSAANFTIAAGGNINASGRGYYGAEHSSVASGPGGGSSLNADPCEGGGGGAYGGSGGNNGAGVFGSSSTYGTAAAPTAYGSGGGANRAFDSNKSRYPLGGNGGGAVVILVSEMLTIAGSVTADGAPGVIGNATSFVSAGGSGGSVWLRAATLNGSGSISAVGGASPSAIIGPSCSNNNGKASGAGGGGGGRIDLDFTTNSFLGTISKAGGTAGTITGGSPSGVSGTAGTMCLNGAGCT